MEGALTGLLTVDGRMWDWLRRTPESLRGIPPRGVGIDSVSVEAIRIEYEVRRNRQRLRRRESKVP